MLRLKGLVLEPQAVDEWTAKLCDEVVVAGFDSDRPAYLLHRAEEQYGHGQFQEACEAYTTYLVFTPTAEVHFLRSLCFREQGCRKDELHDMDQALARDPTSRKLRYHRATIHLEEENWEAAASDFKSVLHFDCPPSRVRNVIILLLSAQFRVKDRAEMNLWVDQALKVLRFPEDQSTVLLWSAYNALLVEDYAEALAEHQDALVAFPKNRTVRLELAWFLATCPDAAFRNGKLALSHAAEAGDEISTAKMDLLHYYGILGAVNAEAGNFPEALSYVEKFLALAPQNGNLAFGQKVLELYRNGKAFYQEKGTIELLHKEVETQPDLPNETLG